MAVRTSASLPLATSLPPVPWLRRVPGATLRRFPPRRVIVPEDQASECLHVVDVGAVVLSCTHPAGLTAALGVLGPGEVFGAEALAPWTGGPAPPWACHSPEAWALLPSRVLSVPVQEFQFACSRDPWIALWAAASLACRVRLFEMWLARALLLSVTERVRTALEEIALRFGHRTPQGIQIQLPLTQESLASMVGATRESVNRALRALTRQGVLRRSQGSYLLVQAPRWRPDPRDPLSPPAVRSDHPMGPSSVAPSPRVRV